MRLYHTAFQINCNHMDKSNNVEGKMLNYCEIQLNKESKTQMQKMCYIILCTFILKYRRLLKHCFRCPHRWYNIFKWSRRIHSNFSTLNLLEKGSKGMQTREGHKVQYCLSHFSITTTEYPTKELNGGEVYFDSVLGISVHDWSTNSKAIFFLVEKTGRGKLLVQWWPGSRAGDEKKGNYPSPFMTQWPAFQVSIPMSSPGPIRIHSGSTQQWVQYPLIWWPLKSPTFRLLEALRDIVDLNVSNIFISVAIYVLKINLLKQV